MHGVECIREPRERDRNARGEGVGDGISFAYVYILPFMCQCQMHILACKCLCQMRLYNVRTEGYTAHDSRDDEKARKVPLLGNGVWFDDVVANRYERTISEERDDHEHQHRKLEEGGPWVAFLDWLADVFSVFVLPKFVSFRVVGLSLEQMRERQEGREGGGARVMVRCLALGGTFDMVFKLERERASDRERARETCTFVSQIGITISQPWRFVTSCGLLYSKSSYLKYMFVGS